VKYTFVTIIILSVIIFPAFAQSEKNPTLILQTIEVPYYDFNKIARDAVVIGLEKPHIISWQITIYNELMYANPNGNAVLRFYDITNTEKFIEIGMGSQPDEKFWIAVQIPEETGYVIVHSKLERGWVPEGNPVLAFTERAGLTVNNGERIVVSNLDVGIFEIGSYSVYGMESSNDPPAISSGNLSMELMSGDPAENQLHLFPFFLAGGIGILVAVLLVTKKRS
jgi:hypothetical protein